MKDTSSIPFALRYNYHACACLGLLRSACWYLPQGPGFSTATETFPIQACRFMWHSLWSCTPSEAQTGLRVSGHVGQIHCGTFCNTWQPMLYGALQPITLQGSKMQERSPQLINHHLHKRHSCLPAHICAAEKRTPSQIVWFAPKSCFLSFKRKIMEWNANVICKKSTLVG